MLRLASGSWSVLGGSRLLGGELRSGGSPFLCDCRDLQRSDPAQSHDPAMSDSDHILAGSFSSSGRFFALTDDRKRLVLFRTQPTWERVSVRWVSRRCTAVTFSACESRVLVADKSGDVFSFSVPNTPEEREGPPEEREGPPEGCLELGHLSMLLDLVVTPDGRYIITCDRDEKIRVSLWGAPHDIRAFCLGHTEFVSRLLVLPGANHLLLSGSGDGTVRLWRYEFGEEIHSWNLRRIRRWADGPEMQRLAVSRLSCSPGGEHLAVLCDGDFGVYIFLVSSGSAFTHTQYISLPYVPADLDFEDSASLWVLSGVRETPIELLRSHEGAWQPAPLDDYMKRVSETIQENWEELEGSSSPQLGFSGLYKAVCDNMASYLMKKEARLQTEKRRATSSPATSAVKVQKT